jgi:multicomponent Na+:H+ antiporter subunit B
MTKKTGSGMSIIVKTITRLTTGLILLYGIYIVFHGHIASEGGFAGGVIIALSFIHLMLAYGKEVALKKISEKASFLLANTGAILFMGTALLGMAFGGVFFQNIPGKGRMFELFSAGILPLSNIALSLIVAFGIFTIFGALVFFKPLGSVHLDSREHVKPVDGK